MENCNLLSLWQELEAHSIMQLLFSICRYLISELFALSLKIFSKMEIEWMRTKCTLAHQLQSIE
jgi:hypothetical protein